MTRYRNSFDKVFVSLILYPVFPIVLFLGGWWGSLMIVPEGLIPIFAAMGLVAGVMVDVLWVRKVVDKALMMSPVWWWLVYIFYTIGCFGFFMGVPVFNVLLGIPVGMVVAGRAKVLKLSQKQYLGELEWVGRVSAGCMLAVSIASAVIALSDPYTASGLRGMLGLSFEVTGEMIWGLVLLGGLGLVAGQYVIVKLSAGVVSKWK